MRVLLLAVILLLGYSTAYAIDEKFSAKELRGNQLHKDSISDVLDTSYFLFSPNLTTYQIRNLVTFKIDEFYNRKMPDTFNVTLKFKVYFWRLVSGSLVPDSSSEISLTIGHNVNSNYDNKAIYTFNGGYHSKVVITNVIVNYGTLSAFQDALVLQNVIMVNREYPMDCIQNAVDTVNYNAGELSTKGELKVYWNPEHPADEYDLEWTYIDSAALTNYYKTGSSTVFDPKLLFTNNSTRVSIARELYYIPLLYDSKGHLFFRVRTVQVKPNGQRVESNWSSDFQMGLGRYDFNGHERLLNWQATTTFAEEGKRKSVVQYFDGSLRNRQTVTKDNTTDTTIVAETFYDYQGRPTIQVMPAPTLSSLIKFTPNFNQANGGLEYDKAGYDSTWSDTCYCFVGATMMDSSSGASKYYSGLNPNKGSGFNKYIPNAFGYPFTETRYTDDNTGRIAIQSGVGYDYQIGKKDASNNTHETKYYYGSADQEELDALFGTEVGKTSHYFKNMVRDANGQYSVSYVDMHGRTVATALAGKPTSKMDTLVTNISRTVTKKLLDSNNNIIKGTTIESSRGLLITKAGNNRFVYSLNPDSISIKDAANVSVCYDCIYDLVITITDECKNTSFPSNAPIVITRTNLSVNGYDTVCNANTAFPALDTTIYLKEGNYLITKQLTISKKAQDYYRDSIFARRNATKTLTQFIQEQKTLLAGQTECQPTCATCLDSLGTWTSFRNKYLTQLGIPIADTASYREQAYAAYTSILEQCNALCSSVANNTDIRSKMKEDITPPYGQYANPNSIDQYSVLKLISSGSARNYSTIVKYTDVSGKDDWVQLSDGRIVLPKDLSLTEFIENYRSSWSDSLIRLHPEYCRLKAYDSLQASHLWDIKFGNVNTYKAALDSGYLNPANFPSLYDSSTIYRYDASRRDPLFVDLKPSYKNEMLDSLKRRFQDPQGQWVNAWSLATIMAHCKTTDISCGGYYRYLSRAFSSDTSCSGELDVAWRFFREMYLQEKREIVYKIISANCGASIDFTKYSPNFPNPVNAIDANSVTSGTYADTISAFVADYCTQAAEQWMQELAACNYSDSDKAVIIPRLIQVCKEGGDSGHPFGSSTVKPSSTYAYRSFDQVLREYNPAKYNASCNAYLISSPKPYEKVISYNDKIIDSKPDSCECSQISNWYTRYTAEKLTSETFSQFVLRSTNITISTSALDSLRQVCNGTINCTYLKTPLRIPSIFQCSIESVCADCKLVSQTFNGFKVAFPGQFPKKDPNDSSDVLINQTFRNYMNYNLGFGKEALDYLDFMDSCQIGYGGSLVSSCDTLNSILAQYLDTSAKNSSYYSTDCQQKFTTFFNQLKGTSLTYAQIDSIYFNSCNIRLSICPSDAIYKCDTLNRLLNDAYQFMLTPHYDATQCDSTYWVLNYSGSQPGAPPGGSSSHDVPSPLGNIIQSGIAHVPDSVVHPTGVNHIDWDHKRNYCLPDSFYFETRVKIPDSTVTVPNTNLALYFSDFKRRVTISFYPSTKSIRMSENGTILNTYTIDTFTKFNEYKVVRVEFRKDSMKVYYDGMLLYRHKLQKQLSVLTYMTLQTYSLKPYFDYVKLNRIDGDTIMYQGYDNCNSARYGSAYVSNSGSVGTFALTSKLFNPYYGTNFNYTQIDSIYLRYCNTPAGIDMISCALKCDTITRYYYDYRASQLANACNGNFACSKDQFVNYMNGRLGVVLTYANWVTALGRCGIVADPSTSTSSRLLCGNNSIVFPTVEAEQPGPCDDSTNFAIWKGTVLYENYRDSIIGSFDDKYLAKCLNARKTESFTVNQSINEFHYTLYYYDQAGNLLKTVPPEGVDLSKFGWISNWSDSVRNARTSNTLLTPTHRLVTNYRYNTLNQVVAQNSPDGGTTEFWYDRLGRLAISRNAKQKYASATENNRLYSYTQYDALGRITEVGQIKNNNSNEPMTDALSRSVTNLNSWYLSRYNLREQITQTVYDLPFTGFTGMSDNRLIVQQRNLRNRVSYVMYTDLGSSGGYNAATYYTYDIHGNVDTLLQDYGTPGVYPNIMNKNANRYKKIVYKYDLISGKVNMVMYQPGWGDMFIHRYGYDAENRLTLVETSTDSLVWEREARYEYYRHGPLARMVIGEQLVQGLDYAYTLQGWLKGVNSTGATSLQDMGGDGRNTGVDTFNRYTARDVYSYTLNYFDGEYKPINTGVNPFPGSAVTFGSTDYRPLYNGNISSMASNIRQFSDPSMQGGPILLYNYTYDQLNRLKAMDVYNSYNSGSNSWSASSKLAAFAERIAYDGNGNILKYFRNGAAENAFPGYDATIDSLSYKYYANTNRLQRVTDNVRADKLGANSWDFNYDIDNQTDASNYKYDSIGNLISDVAEKIDTIKWSVYGKILEIKKTDPVTNHVINILYKYDAMGNRIGKVVSKYGTSTRDFTWYVRDAQGNIMATYNTSGTATDVNLQTLALGTSEKYIYGSSRLGMDRWYVTTDSGQLYDMRWYNSNTFRRGWKNYELSNHLGNVLATISDKKKGVPLANSSLIDYFEADVQTAQDYYPFGMLMPHRSYASTANYRFGFNGKENDNEPKGLGNQQDYAFRIYDPRIGKFLSVDPLSKNFPWNTPYAFSENDPIDFIDLEGLQTLGRTTQSSMGSGSLRIVRPTIRNISSANLRVIRGGLFPSNISTRLPERPLPRLFEGPIADGDMGFFEETPNGNGRYIPSMREVGEINAAKIKEWDEAPMKERANEINRAREEFKRKQMGDNSTTGLISEDKINRQIFAQAAKQKSSYAPVPGATPSATTTTGTNNSSQRIEEQYALVASKDGWYPNFEFGKGQHGQIYLKKGEVWKYGTTVNPDTRYKQSFLVLTGTGLDYKTEERGTTEQVLIWEQLKLFEYRMRHGGQLPPGNTKNQ